MSRLSCYGAQVTCLSSTQVGLDAFHFNWGMATPATAWPTQGPSCCPQPHHGNHGVYQGHEIQSQLKTEMVWGEVMYS